MRIVFIGAVQFSEACLKRLIEMRVNVVAVCTLKESSFNADHVDLTDFCQKNDIPVCYTPDINSQESTSLIRFYAPDVLFCFGWSRMLKSELLHIAPLGVVGYHPAALPENRGRHPLIWALMLGLSETASSFFFMDEGADSGDILSQKPVSITESDDAGTLYKKVTETALSQLEEFIPELASGHYQKFPQDHSKANTWRKRGNEDGKIDWRMSAKSIHNLVRGLTKPYIGAHFKLNDKLIKVWKIEVISNQETNIEPGKVISKNTHGAVVKAGEDAIQLVETEPFVKLQTGSYL